MEVCGIVINPWSALTQMTFGLYNDCSSSWGNRQGHKMNWRTTVNWYIYVLRARLLSSLPISPSLCTPSLPLKPSHPFPLPRLSTLISFYPPPPHPPSPFATVRHCGLRWISHGSVTSYVSEWHTLWSTKTLPLLLSWWKLAVCEIDERWWL